ncbi:nitroreductase family protein [Synechococcus sp. R55.6]|jgi:Nitroreductase|uniref:nitroreductase family protein n=1 Tax=unclassified Synechococcus TaxID=2626047 RepID=UPI000069499B|nr:nitroreductase family protein [Synechococcus sp. JA-2-3B'a(2-13)]ABD01050.1 nitroreductase family protein [Synechococcus sp. JA-2-3B'a(2-13)]
MDALTALKERISADKLDPSRRLSEAEIRELVAYATEAPSSFNIQHWRFVAVTDPEDKERLKSLAYNQQKVADASVVFIILGDLRGYEKLPEIVQRSVAAGILPPEKAEGWVNMAQATYLHNPTLARDEAIRSGAMAAMALMIAAQAKGLVSGPMIGFDPEGVKREFGIADRYVPVMLLAVGYAAAGNLPRKPRLGVDEVLAFGRGREF